MLKEIGSQRLGDYLMRAREDGRDYVVGNARKIAQAHSLHVPPLASGISGDGTVLAGKNSSV